MSVLLLVGCSGSGNDNNNGNRNAPDNTSPVITLTGDDPQVIVVGEAYVELGATASDNRDGDLTSSIVINASAVDTSVPGTYQVHYNVSDAAGNAATTVTRTVIYEDRTPPVITLLGDHPQIIVLGDAYVELGATATDNVDGVLTDNIVIDTTNVDVAVLGDYEVMYDVSDAAGNVADTVIRTVTVKPPAPVIQLTHNRMPYTTPGTTVQLGWFSSGAATCEASGAWAGARATQGSEDVGVLWETTSYSLTCTGAGGPTTVTLKVLVDWPPLAGIKAVPSEVLPGWSTTLTWGSLYATSCYASGDWSDPIGTSGTLTIGQLNSDATFTVNCSGDGGSTTASTSIVLTTFPVASVSLDVRPTTIGIGQSAQGVVNLQDSGGVPLGGRLVTWSSSDPEVASISPVGRAIARTPGVVEITTESEGQQAQRELTVTAVGSDNRQAIIDLMYSQLAGQISNAIYSLERNLPRNPRNRQYMEELLELLRSPTLEDEIRNGDYYEASVVESVDSRRLPIVAMFPRATLRENAIRANGYVQLGLPLLEEFLQLRFPYSSVQSWYGFNIGNRGGGGRIWNEDQATYETRRGPVVIGYLPFEAIVHHEVAHSYFGNEGLTQFLELYLYNRIYTNSLEVDSWVYTRDYKPFLETNRFIHGLLDIYQLIGHDAMARAYQALYPLRPPYGQKLSEAGKQVILNETPLELQDQVRSCFGLVDTFNDRIMRQEVFHDEEAVSTL